MRNLFIILISLTISISSFAIPAYPYKIPISVNDHSLFIRLFGDEYNKWGETEDGYTIVQDDNNQWCYAEIMTAGFLKPSVYSLSAKYQHQEGFEAFLNKQPKHLRPTQFVKNKNNESFRIGRAIGERRVLVILMEYQDVKFSKTNLDFNNLFNQVSYREDGAKGSVKDYYLSSSYGQLTLTSDIFGPYTAEHQMSYYGNNGISGGDVNPYALFTEAMNHVITETDLKLYDADGDGFLDNVHIIFAGYGEEAGGPKTAIWSHEMSFGKAISIGGVMIDRYSCAPELRGKTGKGISRIGPHCHEIGHALGAMDYYDTDYDTNGEFEGTGLWDVMASGSWNQDGIVPADFNPYVKYHDYGWIAPKLLPSGNVTLTPSNDTPEDYYILSPSGNGDYYLLENRKREQWGEALPGEGLLIYHIHFGLQQARNKINASAPQMCYIVCASSKFEQPSLSPASYGDINSAGCPYPGSSRNRTFDNLSTPMAFYWSGDACGIQLRDITRLNNGNIELFNASDGADYKPKQTEVLFFDGFESEPLFSVIEQKDVNWEVVENTSNTVGFATRPSAHTGNKCLQLSAKGQYLDNANSTIELDFQPSNHNGTIILSCYYTSTGIRKTANTLKFGYKSTDCEDWVYSEIKSSVNTTWNSFTTQISLPNITAFRIEGTAVPGTVLAIDDIEIEREVVDDNSVINIPYTLTRSNTARSFEYSLTGLRLPRIRKGLRVMSNGRKIFIK